jgi:hypothetical protein
MKRALVAWWFAPAPAARLAALRIAIGVYASIYVLARAGELVGLSHLPAGSFAALGVVRGPVPPEVVIAIVFATVILLALFTLGIAYKVVAPLAAAALLWTLTYRSAWGQLFHTDNLVVLHVIALACAPAADAWACARRSADEGGAQYGWAIKLLAALTVATYLVAGIAKLRLAGLAWLGGEPLRHQLAFDNARALLLGGEPARLALPVLAHPTWLAMAAIATLIVELGAPLALVDRRVATVWVITAWAFHLGVLALMHVGFPYALTGVAFFPLLAGIRGPRPPV